MNEILNKIQKTGIVPVVVLDRAEDAKPLAKALCAGGLPCAEVTFRTEVAEESIRIMAENFPDMLIGAGTVLTTEQVDRAVAAGASFIVSPGLNPEIVRYCVSKDILIIPGTTNPSDVEQAIQFGLEAVKFFPAEAAGGLKMIQSMAAPYHKMMFMPTGGINTKNINDYLAFSKILACGGSWMVSSALVKEGAFDKIEALTREAVMKMLDFRLMHVGINCEGEKDAFETAKQFSALFELETKEGAGSIFAGSMLEAMKKPGRGKNGHIAVGTNSVSRAVSYLESQGIAFLPETAVYEGENLKAVYLEQEIGGFAVHLVKK
ncbi:MAG: bifunctional 4-hydroxy-2-oxoglutarate aldolase/2-dehydro-3-deoxy-phosphogluconate aldolase [Lachnospiraceae bacterium]|nr:bifunctional 4-hydroxy-2-oxoglutarate aldolase/2-dehydro-3-deoxy-phosphogluconate aldolase [Lachnospiraceae bacterium]